MSTNERRQSKQVKTLCAACRARKARFRYRGEVRADRDHTLCFECHRGEVNRARARRLTGHAASPLLRPPFGQSQSVARPQLTDRQIAHRERMVDHLHRRSSVVF